MRRSPSRSASNRLGASRLPPSGSRYRVLQNDGSANRRPDGGTHRHGYTNLDWVHNSPENYTLQREFSDEAPKPRVRHQPEEFLTVDKSSFSMKKLSKVAPPETAAEEESILKKWEAWSKQISSQLALESAVPTTTAVRVASRNSNLRSVSQPSSQNISRLRPESARGFSPRSQSGRRSMSRCSSNSRQSSLVSTIVDPFRVGDRMTASAERRRYRPQSTKESRELLFRRALGLEEEKNDIQNLSKSSSSGRPAPGPSPLVALSKTTSTARQSAEIYPPPLTGMKNAGAYPVNAGQEVRELLRELKPLKAKDPAEAGAPSAIFHKEVIPQDTSLVPTDAVSRAEDRGEEWLQESVALLKSRDQPFTEGSEKKATPKKDGSLEAPLPIAKKSASGSMEDKLHLSVGEAAQLIGDHAMVENVDNCPIPSISCRDDGSGHDVDIDDCVSPNNSGAHDWVGWPIDRASVTVLFVDHHVDDDQLSAYGVDVSFRDECAPEVLPDWNESRRLFAPTPLEDSQSLQ